MNKVLILIFIASHFQLQSLEFNVIGMQQHYTACMQELSNLHRQYGILYNQNKTLALDLAAKTNEINQLNTELTDTTNNLIDLTHEHTNLEDLYELAKAELERLDVAMPKIEDSSKYEQDSINPSGGS